MRILVVDDNSILRRSLMRALAFGHDVSVEEAGGVSEARTLLFAREYDVIVSDQQMPDGLGSALLATTAHAQPWCRRVLMSGTTPPMKEGAAWERFFPKPDGINALIAWIRELATRDA